MDETRPAPYLFGVSFNIMPSTREQAPTSELGGEGSHRDGLHYMDIKKPQRLGCGF